MVSPRTFLIRGLLAGLFAGIAAFGVAFVAGEPSVRASIAIEEAAAPSEPAAPADESGHEHGSHETTVPRTLQSTLGMLSGTVVAGATLGGLVGVLSALAMGRFGALRPRATTLLVTGIGFVAVSLVPYAGYPPNPPAVGHAETIGLRTTLFFCLMAVSVLAAVTSLLVGRRVARTCGAWRAGVVALAAYLLVVIVAIVLLPTYDEVPADFPATVLYQFRMASLLTQVALWGVLGVTLASLVGRLTRSPRPPARELATAVR